MTVVRGFVAAGLLGAAFVFGLISHFTNSWTIDAFGGAGSMEFFESRPYVADFQFPLPDDFDHVLRLETILTGVVATLALLGLAAAAGLLLAGLLVPGFSIVTGRSVAIVALALGALAVLGPVFWWPPMWENDVAQGIEDTDDREDADSFREAIDPTWFGSDDIDEEDGEGYDYSPGVGWFLGGVGFVGLPAAGLVVLASAGSPRRALVAPRPSYLPPVPPPPPLPARQAAPPPVVSAPGPRLRRIAVVAKQKARSGAPASKRPKAGK